METRRTVHTLVIPSFRAPLRPCVAIAVRNRLPSRLSPMVDTVTATRRVEAVPSLVGVVAPIAC